jgi:hypothetical protein
MNYSLESFYRNTKSLSLTARQFDLLSQFHRGVPFTIQEAELPWLQSLQALRYIYRKF